MNNESFLKLLHLNFNERNIRMIERFTQERQRFKETLIKSQKLVKYAVDCNRCKGVH